MSKNKSEKQLPKKQYLVLKNLVQYAGCVEMPDKLTNTKLIIKNSRKPSEKKESYSILNYGFSPKKIPKNMLDKLMNPPKGSINIIALSDYYVTNNWCWQNTGISHINTVDGYLNRRQLSHFVKKSYFYFRTKLEVKPREKIFYSIKNKPEIILKIIREFVNHGDYEFLINSDFFKYNIFINKIDWTLAKMFPEMFIEEVRIDSNRNSRTIGDKEKRCTGDIHEKLKIIIPPSFYGLYLNGDFEDNIIKEIPLEQILLSCLITDYSNCINKELKQKLSDSIIFMKNHMGITDKLKLPKKYWALTYQSINRKEVKAKKGYKKKRA